MATQENCTLPAVFHPEIFARGGHHGLFKILGGGGGHHVVWECEAQIPRGGT